MTQKRKPYKKRNSVAHDLHHPKYQQRVVKSKKIYRRKDKHVQQSKEGRVY